MKRFCFLFLHFTLICSACFSEISLEINKETVGLNESFQLTFVSKQQVRYKPDFAALQQDFEIISCVQSHNTSFINGVIDTQAQWDLTLMPKKEGKLVIPAITFDNESSAEKSILVTKGRIAGSDDSIFLETELSPKNAVYQGSQLVCTVRLFRSVNLLQGALSDLKPNDQNAQVQRIGDDIEFDHVGKEGTRYRVLERRYAMFPQQVGKLTFAPVLFEGNILVGKKAFFNVKSEYKRIQAEIPEIDVKPIPVPFTEHTWFPAYDVKLTEEWSSDPDKVAIGEPITWTLTVMAEGCMGAQIPDLKFDLPNHIKQYADKPEIIQEQGPAGFKGIKKIKIALIATKPGNVTLPEISLAWWDLITEKPRTAVIASRTLQIQPDQVAVSDSITFAPPIIEEKINVVQKIEDTSTLPVWVMVLIGLNLIWIIGVYNAIYKKIPLKLLLTKPNQLKNIRKNLKRACKYNHAKDAEKYFLEWASLFHPDVKPLNLVSIKNYFPEQFQEELHKLYKTLYSQDHVWDGKTFWKAFLAYKKPKSAKTMEKENQQKLRSLYNE